jgi:uncharacterized phiE125 gp8 family phage protein
MIPQLTITDSLISSITDSSPSVSALTLAYAKEHIRSLGTSDDTLIQVYINQATSYFEEQTGRQLLTATREAWLNAFPFIGASGGYARIELPKPPLQSVVSVKYIDSAGTLQSYRGGSPLADLFTISAPAGPYARRGFVEPIYGGVWPIARAQTGAVRIQYTCGYGTSMASIPPLIRGILCFLVGHFDTFRSAGVEQAVSELPFGVTQMMDGFKYSALPSQVLREYANVTPAPYGLVRTI